MWFGHVAESENSCLQAEGLEFSLQKLPPPNKKQKQQVQ